jgi:hypothetical protein
VKCAGDVQTCLTWHGAVNSVPRYLLTAFLRLGH